MEDGSVHAFVRDRYTRDLVWVKGRAVRASTLADRPRPPSFPWMTCNP